MIVTVSDLIQKLVEKEKPLLDSQQLNHPPTIGSMYEGLTAEILNKSLFEGLNLNVTTNSFIRNSEGKISDEFDVILSVGDGVTIPYTNKQVFSPQQVIAVFQIKKNLFSSDIKDSYNNLKGIVSLYEKEDLEEDFRLRLIKDSTSAILEKGISKTSRKFYNSNENHILNCLYHDARLPLRIAIGYNGFKRESNLKEAFVSFIEENLSSDLDKIRMGFGPISFPNLIICNNLSIVKNNGMPFGFPITEGEWPVLFTSSEKSFYYLLEIIWTRLSYMFSISAEIFGEDLYMEQGNGFLLSHIANVQGRYLWCHRYLALSEKFLKRPLKGKNWMPVALSKEQFMAVHLIANEEEINIISNKEYKEIAQLTSRSLSAFTEDLLATSLFSLENNIIRLLTKKCNSAIMPDGRFVAGEDITGRFTRWITKEIEK